MADQATTFQTYEASEEINVTLEAPGRGRKGSQMFRSDSTTFYQAILLLFRSLSMHILLCKIFVPVGPSDLNSLNF